MSRRILAICAIALSFLAVATPPPAFAQTAVSMTGYVDAGGRRASVRESTPLPVMAQPFTVPGSRWQYAGVTGGLTTTTAAAVAAAAGAGIRNYVTSIQYLNSSATASEIEIRDGATVIWRGYAPASMAYPASITFSSPLRGTANTAMNVAMVTTATATRVSAQGYVSPN